MSAIPEGSAPAIITAHAYEPDGDWWTTCRHCGLAEAAHTTTTLPLPDSGAPLPWCGTPALIEAERRRREAGES